MTTRRTTKITKTNIGPSASICALMIKVSHSTAPILKLTAHKDLTLSMVTMNVKTGEVVATVPFKIEASQVFYFTASEEHPGYYYVNTVSGVGVVSCSCTGNRRWHHCRHQELVEAFAAQPRIPRQPKAASAIVASPVKAAPAPVPPMPEQLSAEQWHEIVRRDEARQKAEKVAYQAKLEEVRAAASAA